LKCQKRSTPYPKRFRDPLCGWLGCSNILGDPKTLKFIVIPCWCAGSSHTFHYFFGTFWYFSVFFRYFYVLFRYCSVLNQYFILVKNTNTHKGVRVKSAVDAVSAVSAVSALCSKYLTVLSALFTHFELANQLR
jgi:hypothetical protein